MDEKRDGWYGVASRYLLFAEAVDEIVDDESAFAEEWVVDNVRIVGRFVCVAMKCAGKEDCRNAFARKRVLVTKRIVGFSEFTATVECKVKVHFVFCPAANI